ncbi:MAG: putative lipoprotein, partial [Deltaproteobacteria bacterium]|nr:putative lipoprotein [Deltaproteobacteria bacterium]
EPTDPDMNTTLACRANVGTGGPSYEMPLLMSKWALSDRVMDNTNAGFLRDDALLAIVYLTDEDDDSTTANGWTIGISGGDPAPTWNPDDQVQFLDTLKGNRTRWAAGVIAGDGDCSSSFGSAVNATRLKEFVQKANASGTTQAVFSSICAGDLTIGLKNALDTFQAACGSIIL